MSNIIEGITKDLTEIPKNLKAKAGGMDTKKLVLLNLPYIFAGYFCDKVAWLWRVSEGTNASDKMMAVMNRLDKLFANPLPSFHPRDLLIGVAGGIALRLVVYYKAKNVKKFRQGVEYGSARWGNAKDIEPYMDSVFENNFLNPIQRRFLWKQKFIITYKYCNQSSDVKDRRCGRHWTELFQRKIPWKGLWKKKCIFEDFWIMKGWCVRKTIISEK